MRHGVIQRKRGHRSRAPCGHRKVPGAVNAPRDGPVRAGRPDDRKTFANKAQED
jgi:hypothetical protein